MGRKIKYKTEEEEKRQAQLKWSQTYYLKNRQRVLDRAKQLYANKKSEKLKKNYMANKENLNQYSPTFQSK